MKFTLLTHYKELPKRSNTGRMVLEALGATAEQVCWDRLNPPEALVREIEAGGAALVYPGASDEPQSDLHGISHFILIDGTWHEARRIHQRSPYLHRARRVVLRPETASRYNLRKNQKASGLCTAECVIAILRNLERHAQADRLEALFLSQMRPQAALRGSEPTA